MALVVGLGIAFQAPGAHADTVDLEVDAVTYRVDPDAPGQGATLVGFNRAKIARNLTIPATVTHNGTAYPVKRIGEEGLRSARLQAVTLPDGLEEIGKAAFYGNSIDDLVIPDSVVGIGEQAFMNNHMKTVVLPKKLAEIKASTFVNNNLTSIDLPAGEATPLRARRARVPTTPGSTGTPGQQAAGGRPDADRARRRVSAHPREGEALPAVRPGPPRVRVRAQARLPAEPGRGPLLEDGPPDAALRSGSRARTSPKRGFCATSGKASAEPVVHGRGRDLLDTGPTTEGPIMDTLLSDGADRAS